MDKHLSNVQHGIKAKFKSVFKNDMEKSVK